jgi:hypothetical protein
MKKITAALAMLSAIVFASASHAGLMIESGFDLFETQSSGTEFDFSIVPNPQIVVFEGIPLDMFDFGSGLEDVGQTDTIVERTQIADLSSGSDTINIEMVALSLISVDQVDLGFGAGFEDIFIALNTSSPSTQSTMTIFDAGEGEPHGTFNSELNFSFDVIGSVGGFYATIEKTFTSTGSEWQHAPTGETEIDGVNHLLDGSTENEDFWLEGLALHDTGGGKHSVTAEGTVPEPATLALFSLGLAGLGWTRRKKA